MVDLLELVEPVPGGRACDLGCGTGRYTPLLHARVEAGETLGVDSSAHMLAGASEFAAPGISFVQGDLADISGRWDVLFANASLQWLRDHDRLIPTLVGHLGSGGQLAFQVPANFAHPSHTVADEVGRRFGLDPLARHIDALDAARYAEILWGAGLRELDVTERIYGMAMDRTDEVIEWVSGTLLTRFESLLDAEAFAAFRDEYRRELLTRLGDPGGAEPYFFAFPRILCRGRLP